MLLLVDFNNLGCRCIFRKDCRDFAQASYAMFTEILEFSESVSEFLDKGEGLEIVLAHDSVDGYWRNDLYPPYKQDRAKKRDNSGIDWAAFKTDLNIFGEMLGKYTPWKHIQLPKCEADDIIYMLAGANGRPTIIYSTDSDYLQLVAQRVLVYEPHHEDFAEFPKICKISGGEAYCHDSTDYLHFAILTGQGGKDNVYNVRTPSDWDPQKRKPPFGVKAAEKIVASGMIPPELYDNYARNRSLIDMSCIPVKIRNQIREYYEQSETAKADSGKLMRFYGWVINPAETDSILERIARGKTE